MNLTPRIKTVLSAAVFVIAASLTYLGVTHRPPSRERQTTTTHNDTIAGIDGLSEGEAVALPEMRTLTGETATLHSVSAEKFLFVFFTPQCAGCAVDVPLWTSLKVESGQRNTAFYLIDVGHDRAALDKFVEAYELGSMPILVSEGRSVGQVLKVNIVPQYLLISKSGKVLHRWDGIRRYERPPGPAELARFFQ